MGRITREKLCEAAKEVLKLSRLYSRSEEYNEIWYDGLLLGYLQAKFGGMERQYHMKNSKVDFRQRSNRSNRPVLIELAVRTPRKAGALSPSQNKTELKKLVKEPWSKTSTRYLLLLDTLPKPLGEQVLQRYNATNLGAGRPPEHSVTVNVIYIHKDACYRVLCNPYKS